MEFKILGEVDLDGVESLANILEDSDCFVTGIQGMICGNVNDEDFIPYGYGVFDGDTLIGMCSVGQLDDVPDCITEKMDDPSMDVMLLSDLMVNPAYRNKGVAKGLVEFAVSNYPDNIVAAEPFCEEAESVLLRCNFKELGEDEFFARNIIV